MCVFAELCGLRCADLTDVAVVWAPVVLSTCAGKSAYDFLSSFSAIHILEPDMILAIHDGSSHTLETTCWNGGLDVCWKQTNKQTFLPWLTPNFLHFPGTFIPYFSGILFSALPSGSVWVGNEIPNAVNPTLPTHPIISPHFTTFVSRWVWSFARSVYLNSCLSMLILVCLCKYMSGYARLVT